MRQRRQELGSRPRYETDPEWLAQLAAMRQRRDAERALGLPDAAMESRKKVYKGVGKGYRQEERLEKMRRTNEQKRAQVPEELVLVEMPRWRLYPYQQRWIAEKSEELGISESAVLRGMLDEAIKAATD